MDPVRSMFERYFNEETASSIVLLICTILALVVANSFLEPFYNDWLTGAFTIGLRGFKFSETIVHWINDGLMAVFFFVIGLEIRREVLFGELSSFKQAALPIFAAIGGMIFPILLYVFLNNDPNASGGWAIPMATDIAFSLGVLKLLGSRVPYSLKVFLTAFAIVDDLGAILIIAIFYSHSIHWTALFMAIGIVLFLYLLGRKNLYSKYFFFISGIVVWWLFMESGIHATIAGVLMALTIPVGKQINRGEFAGAVKSLSDDLSASEKQKQSETLLSKEEVRTVNEIEALTEKIQSPLVYLENKLHGWVAYIIMPLFAFANAGVAINATNFTTLSVVEAVSLILGNAVGISLFSWLSLKIGFAKLPAGVSFKHISAASILGGIGFTMSLFITNLSFNDPQLINASKVGILLGSLIAGLIGLLVLRMVIAKSPEAKTET